MPDPVVILAIPVIPALVGHLTRDSRYCPHCKANLVHSEIPAEHRHCYLGFEMDAATGRRVPKQDDGRPLYYYRTVGQSSLLFDRCLAYTCPDCKATDIIPGCEEMWDEEQAYWAEKEQRRLLA